MRVRAAIAAFALVALAASAKAGMILPGGTSNKPINIESTKLDYFDKEQKLIYSGNVIAQQGDAKLKATTLTIFLAAKGSAGAASTNQVQRMIAAGPVTLVQRDQIGTGDNGVYDKAANSVVLTGNVTLSQGPNVTKGDRLTYDLRTGQAVVTGRVKSMFLPSSNSGGDTSSSDTPRARSGRRPAGSAAD